MYVCVPVLDSWRKIESLGTILYFGASVPQAAGGPGPPVPPQSICSPAAPGPRRQRLAEVTCRAPNPPSPAPVAPACQGPTVAWGSRAALSAQGTFHPHVATGHRPTSGVTAPGMGGQPVAASRYGRQTLQISDNGFYRFFYLRIKWFNKKYYPHKFESRNVSWTGFRQIEE